MQSIEVFFPAGYTAQQVRDHLYSNYLRNWTRKYGDADFDYDESFHVVIMTGEQKRKALEACDRG